ncbi:putative membrane protein [Borreliella burgdorferi JD1]|nr:putative membrane protein [Borreliella burgdorferi JD1]
MKKNIYILNIFLYIPLFYSCFLTPPKSTKSKTLVLILKKLKRRILQNIIKTPLKILF